MLLFQSMVITLFMYGLVQHVLPLCGTDMGTGSKGSATAPTFRKKGRKY